MRLTEFEQIRHVKGRDEFRQEVFRFTKRIGFDTFNATAVLDRPGGEPMFSWVENTPDAYTAYADSVQYSQRDPVAQHCKRFSTPMVWDQRTYVSEGVGDRWELQAQYGYRSGIALALHLPAGVHFFVGLDRDGPLPNDSAEIARLGGALHLFVSYAQEASHRVLLNDLLRCDARPALSARELEALWWTMEGKTAWEVGAILSISEQTAARHLNNATRKLSCANKHHAVVKALRLGLIH